MQKPIHRPLPRAAAPSVELGIALAARGIELTIRPSNGGSRAVAAENLASAVRKELNGLSTETEVVITAAADVPYARIIDLLDAVRNARFARFSVRTD